MRKSLIISIFILFFSILNLNASSTANVEVQVEKEYQVKSLTQLLTSFYQTTGINAILNPKEGVKDAHGRDMSIFAQSSGRVIMLFICFILFYLAIKKGFEPLLLIPIGFGGLLANIPIANLAGPDGMLGIIYNMGIANEFFPLLIFMGVGAMTDFGPLLSNPKTALLGGAAQFGIFGSLVGAVVLTQYVPGI